MAERKITLTMTASEEAALSQVLHWACVMIKADEVPTFIKQHAEKIGSLNGALNAND